MGVARAWAMHGYKLLCHTQHYYFTNTAVLQRTLYKSTAIPCLFDTILLRRRKPGEKRGVIGVFCEAASSGNELDGGSFRLLVALFGAKSWRWDRTSGKHVS